jgi:hypothetical protein
MPFNIVRANPIQDIGVAGDGKREAVGFADTSLPHISTLWITLTLHLLCSSGRIPDVLQKKRQRLVSLSL